MNFIDSICEAKNLSDIFTLAEAIETDDPDTEIKIQILAKEIRKKSQMLSDLITLVFKLCSPAGKIAGSEYILRVYQIGNKDEQKELKKLLSHICDFFADSQNAKKGKINNLSVVLSHITDADACLLIKKISEVAGVEMDSGVITEISDESGNSEFAQASSTTLSDSSKRFFDFLNKKIEANPASLPMIKNDLVKFGLAMKHSLAPEPFAPEYLKNLTKSQFEALMHAIQASSQFKKILEQYISSL